MNQLVGSDVRESVSGSLLGGARTDETAAISFRGLGKCFGTRPVLRALDFDLRKGERVTIFGPNGAGKTTLIRILATLMKPTYGTLAIEGREVKDAPALVRRSIGVISHRPLLYDDLSALENLKFFGTMYDVPKLESRARELLAMVGLASRVHDQVRTFSRGMQQRVSLARALLHDPPVLLLDEPDTGVDQSFSLLQSVLLADQRARSILMTTHNLELGLKLADRVLILQGGRFAYEARRDAINLEDLRLIYEGLLKQGYKAKDRRGLSGANARVEEAMQA